MFDTDDPEQWQRNLASLQRMADYDAERTRRNRMEAEKRAEIQAKWLSSPEGKRWQEEERKKQELKEKEAREARATAERAAKERIESLYKAVEQGDVEAQYKLGIAYENGNDVSRDYVKSREFIRKAAAQGHKEAKNFIAREKAEKAKQKRDKIIGNIIPVIKPAIICGVIGGLIGYASTFERPYIFFFCCFVVGIIIGPFLLISKLEWDNPIIGVILGGVTGVVIGVGSIFLAKNVMNSSFTIIGSIIGIIIGIFGIKDEDIGDIIPVKPAIICGVIGGLIGLIGLSDDKSALAGFFILTLLYCLVGGIIIARRRFYCEFLGSFLGAILGIVIGGAIFGMVGFIYDYYSLSSNYGILTIVTGSSIGILIGVGGFG